MNSQENIRMQSQKDPAQLEHEIDQQRNHIEEIVRALESRLSPGQMLRGLLDSGKGGSGEFARNLGNTIKANPVPALMTAAGMVWLYAGQSRQPSASTGQSRTHAMGERVQDMREGVSGKLDSARQRTGESMHHAADRARDGARRANEGARRMLNENPMAAGAIAIAVGALLGSLLPSTRKEDELLGRTSDRLKGEARHLAREGRDKITEAGREVTGGDGATPPHAAPRAGTSTGAAGASTGTTPGTISPDGGRPI